MPAKKHLHVYVRSKLNKHTYKCNDPDCSHFSRWELIVDKSATCPGCGNKFILTRDVLDLATPKCEFCRKQKVRDERFDIFNDLFKDKGKEIDETK